VPRKPKSRDGSKREDDEPIEPPTDERWQRTIDFFLVLQILGSAVARRRAEKLALALDQEALAVFHVARKLESGLPLVLNLKERSVEHGRSSIVAKLHDFAKRYIDLAGLDAIDEQIREGPVSWYRQGALLLDAAERVRAYVAAYHYTDVRRLENERGTVAWSYLVAEAKRWGASNEEVAQRLADAGYVRTELDVFNLKDNVRKHRQRRTGGRKPRKTPKRRSRKT
jgi:hypothetical protein